MAPCPVTGDALARLLPAGMNYSPVWPPHFLTGKSPAVFPENGSPPAEGLTTGVHRFLAVLGWAVGKRSCCTIGAIRFMGGTTRHWAPGASVEPPLQCPSLWVIVRSWGGHAKALPYAPLPPPAPWYLPGWEGGLSPPLPGGGPGDQVLSDPHSSSLSSASSRTPVCLHHSHQLRPLCPPRQATCLIPFGLMAESRGTKKPRTHG